MTEPSPYTTPNSKLNEEMVLPEQGTIIRRLDASRGALWFFDGFRRFFKSPGSWLLIGLVNFLILLLLTLMSLIPVIGSFLSYLFYPILVAGFMYACKNQDQGKIQASDLFSGFSRQTNQLFVIGALYVAMMIGMLVVALILVFAIGLPFFSDNGINLQDNPQQLILISLLFILIFIGLTLPIIMGIWFAPALTMIKEIDAISAIKLSFTACLRNFMPYLIYGLIALAFYAILGLLVAFTIGASMLEEFTAASIITAILTGLLFFIIAAPATFISIYSAYLDIFEAAQVTASEKNSETSDKVD